MNKKIGLIICGHGALADAVFDYTQKQPPDTPILFDDIRTETGPLYDSYAYDAFVGIHAGKSGAQLPEFVAFCEHNDMPLIQAATGMTLPSKLKIPIIDAPNMAIEIIAFLKHLPAFIDSITKENGVAVKEASLMESHQETKGSSVPGTARKIGSIIGVPDYKIVSIRKPDRQLQLGIPAANLDRHAYHWAELEFIGGTRIGLHTKVHGLETYAKGALFLAHRVIEMGLPPGLHPMTKLL